MDESHKLALKHSINRMNTASTKMEPAHVSHRTGFFHPGAFRYSAVELLAALALLFLSAPFIEDLPNGDLIEAVLMRPGATTPDSPRSPRTNPQ
jgi:hypothetical protein